MLEFTQLLGLPYGGLSEHIKCAWPIDWYEVNVKEYIYWLLLFAWGSNWLSLKYHQDFLVGTKPKLRHFRINKEIWEH